MGDHPGRLAILSRAMDAVDSAERDRLLKIAVPALMAAGRREEILADLRRAAEARAGGTAESGWVAVGVLESLLTVEMSEHDRLLADRGPEGKQ